MRKAVSVGAAVVAGLVLMTLAFLLLQAQGLEEAPGGGGGGGGGGSGARPEPDDGESIRSSQDFLATLSEEERAWLSAHPHIRVVQDPFWPPVEFADSSGEPSGMSEDYLRLVERRLGIRFERAKGLNWQEAYAALRRWELDMTTSVTPTPERETFWAFTEPYMRIPLVIATRFDVPYIADMRELNGERVAVVEGYAVVEWFKTDYPGIELVPVDSARVGLERLQRGEVFAFVDNLLIIGDYQAKMKAADLKIAGQTPYENSLSMAVRKDWAPLAGILQKALASIPEAERAAIYRKWLPVRYEYGFDYRLLWRALAIFALILLALGLWIRRLGAEARRRALAEEGLKRSLEEKEVLLREVNHRVKNNLTVISSLLNLQSAELHTPAEAMEAFANSRDRIMAMALVHEELYQSGDYANVDMQGYLGRLCEQLARAYDPDGRVAVRLEAAGVSLAVSESIPCGLILNELITNAYKHAFGGGRSGSIAVNLRRNAGAGFVLTVADDGAGMPEPAASGERISLGLTLVRLLVQQLNGALETLPGPGTAFRIAFPGRTGSEEAHCGADAVGAPFRR